MDRALDPIRPGLCLHYLCLSVRRCKRCEIKTCNESNLARKVVFNYSISSYCYSMYGREESKRSSVSLGWVVVAIRCVSSWSRILSFEFWKGLKKEKGERWRAKTDRRRRWLSHESLRGWRQRRWSFQGWKFRVWRISSEDTPLRQGVGLLQTRDTLLLMMLEILFSAVQN